MGDEVPEGDIDEMRKSVAMIALMTEPELIPRAAWATWRTEAPSAASRPGGTNNEDDDLARSVRPMVASEIGLTWQSACPVKRRAVATILYPAKPARRRRPGPAPSYRYVGDGG